MILLSLSPSAPYLATPHLSLDRIGFKHIPSYFAFPIVYLTHVALLRAISYKFILFCVNKTKDHEFHLSAEEQTTMLIYEMHQIIKFPYMKHLEENYYILVKFY